MSYNERLINALTDFRTADKFSSDVWKDRGLRTPQLEFSDMLSELLNECVDSLIAAVKADATSKELLSLLKSGLSKFKKDEL